MLRLLSKRQIKAEVDTDILSPDTVLDSGIPPAYFDPARNVYWFTNSRGLWIPISETGMKRQLRRFLRSRAHPDEMVAPLDAHINSLQTEFDVSYAGPLAGSKKGLLDYEKRKILVTESPSTLSPTEGEWPLLGKILENLLNDERGDQRPFLYGWLKIAREGLISGKNRSGQALVMAGPRDCGKSLVQNLVTRLLGGRVAKPYGWMTGRTDFNAELFGAEHLMIEDECASTDIRARRNFGAQLKSVTVNTVQKCHQKNRTALTLEPFWRVTITVNDEPENLMVLPPIDDSLEDKIILLRANKFPMPRATATQDERRAFMEQLNGELPAFCHFLDNWEIPADLVSHRFGICHYHHPDLLRALDDLAPETRLLQLLESEVKSQWSGTQTALENFLIDNEKASTHEARRLFSFNNACGVYLGRLATKYPDAVRQDRTSAARLWTIWPNKVVTPAVVPPVQRSEFQDTCPY